MLLLLAIVLLFIAVGGGLAVSPLFLVLFVLVVFLLLGHRGTLR